MNFIFLKTWVYYSIIYDAGTIINVFMVISKKDFWCVDRVNIYFYVRILNVKFVPYVISLTWLRKPYVYNLYLKNKRNNNNF